MKNQIIKSILVLALFLSAREVVFAANVTLTVRDGSSVIFTGSIPLPTAVISLNDDTSTPHTLDPNSVLAVLDTASLQPSSNFTISDLKYFSSFGSFYLKCITETTGGQKCDDWQYAIGNSSPRTGMDKNILNGGENVYVYFGDQNRVVLNNNNIKTTDTLTVTTQVYDYTSDNWTTRTGVTVGLTQPDPNNQFSPIEVKTAAVDSSGKATFSSIPAGSYDVGIKEDFYFPTKSLTVTTPPPAGASGLVTNINLTTSSTTTPAITIAPVVPAVVPTAPTKPTFDIKKAYDFLTAQQNTDGSWSSDLYTDWSALALASGNNQTQVLKLVKYMVGAKIESSNLTDYERHAMALMALGLNPYDTNGVNYIEKITGSFDGKQFGDVNQDNDDIFALIVLQNAGYKIDDSIINTDISFILGAQNTNGSWDGSVDMTGAAVEALAGFSHPLPVLPDSPFAGEEGIQNALAKAEDFLKQNQKDNGSWNDNASSTAWALQGLLAMNEKPEDWIKNGNSPFDYLATIQDTDGGVKDESLTNKIWETAYVASTLSGKSWNQTMQSFEKPIAPIAPTAPIVPIAPVATKPAPVQNIPANKVSITKNPKPKLENTASVINAIAPSPTPIQTETPTPKKNWFRKLLDNIFGN
jgi:hypothetical protein